VQTQAEPRVRKRLPCTLSLEARQHNGLILNLSARGLFVQTTLPAEPGTLLDLDVRDPVLGQPIPLQAAVVWRRRVSPRMTGTNQSGMGLRLLSRPAAWESMMSDLLASEGVAEAAGTAASAPPEAARHTEASDASAPPAPVWFVRLGQAGGPRSRHLLVESDDEPSAREEALRRVGAGWTVLEVRPR